MTSPVNAGQPLFEAIEEDEAASLGGGGLQYVFGFTPYPTGIVTYSQGSAFVEVDAVWLPFAGVNGTVKYTVGSRSGGFGFAVPSALIRR